MRKRIAGCLIGIVFGAMAVASVSVKTMALGTDIIDEDNMQLIQNGDFVVPSNDYSFDDEDMIAYLDGEESADNEQQLATQAARADDNATLPERKEACAKVLYTAMKKYDESVNVAEFALTKEEFKATISDLINSNPELFYIGQAYGVKSFYLTGNSGTQIVKECMGFYECQSPIREKRTVGDTVKEVTVGYTDIDINMINSQKEMLESRKKAIIQKLIYSGMTDVEKALVIHDYLALHIKYDYKAYLDNKEKGTNVYDEPDYDIYGALIDGKAVCQGYTLAYKYLLEAAGVDNVGFASNTTHIWNTISIGEDNYYVDCTWDDPSWDTLGNVKHKYLLKGGSDFTGHGTIEKSDRECNGTEFSGCFWDEVNSGIFYNGSKFYYINKSGELCVKKAIDDTPYEVIDLSLKEDEYWNFVNAAKLVLGDNYAVYHDKKNIYVYDCKHDEKKILFTPEIDENEYIYGISSEDNVLQFGTRDKTSNGISEQKIYTYNLPQDPFNIPIEKISITGPDTLHISMSDGKYNYEKGNLKAVISPSDATNQKIRSWVSSDTGILTVDLNGMIKAVSPGEVKVTVTTMEGPKAEKTVKVVYDGDIAGNDGTVLHYENGVLKKDTFYIENGKKYYLGSDGKPVKGFMDIGNDNYYFDDKGVMLTGWQTIGGDRYYFNSSGVMQKGCFLDYSGSRYYLDANGKMVTGLVLINVNKYLFNSDGVMLTGWQNISGSGKHYFNSKGVMLTGWQTIDGKTYYFNSDGVMLTGWQTIDGNTYYFDENGVWLTVGWQTINGNKYYFNMQGVPVKGWNTISGKKYYFNKNGIMLTGWRKINNKKYFFNKKGVMHTGWKTIKKKKYYFSKKGVMQTGWKTIKKKKYYFNKKGVMQTGWQTINGRKYYFNDKGIMLSGLQTIKGISYYFAGDGHFVS